MRVLVLSDLFPPVAFGGYEIECAALVDRLREHHDVLVLTSDLRRGEARAVDDVRRVLPYEPSSGVRATLGAPRAALRGARTTERVLAEFAPDAVYVSNGVRLPQAVILVAARAGAPVVCRFSELFFAGEFLRGDRFLRDLGPGARGLRGAWARVSRVADRHPALRLDVRTPFPASISWASEALRDAAGVPPGIAPRLQRVIHPASPRTAAFASVERAPDPEPVVTYVGRATEAKGALVAVEALALLRERHEIPARLVFAGACEPDMARRLDALAAARGVGDRVERLGMVDLEGLAALFSRSTAVLVPSVQFDTFPLVLAEAATARVPIVASRVGGIPEALLDGKHALLFAPGDAGACVTALAATIQDPGAASARADRAAERARGLTLDDYLDRSEELITDAVQDHAR